MAAADNLLLNALEAMDEGGQLIACVPPSRDWKRCLGSVLRMTIADSGPGILAHICRSFLSRFSQPKLKREPGSGSG
ncbi:MAG TPA: ATP-binding protein [Silvibacterium sp.]|nr:ATP-binding protein [Silvibacterium sp.]